MIEFRLGVLFENSIVCHVFYAMALGAAHGLGCVWFLGFCFVLVCLALFVVGLGWAWSGFLDCCTDYWVLAGCLFVVGWGLVLLVLFGEFDPGSGRTLAACLTHASRTVKGSACWFWMSGERVSNT